MHYALCRVERLSGTLQCKRLSGGSSNRPGLVKRPLLGRLTLLVFLSVVLLILFLAPLAVL